MKKLPATEHKCSACNGTGFPMVKQPIAPGRKIYSPPCKTCGGKGRIKEAATWGRPRALPLSWRCNIDCVFQKFYFIALANQKR
jgi:hypothetical protein